MIKKYFIYIYLLFSSTFLGAQKEANHWFFGGNAGLDFSSGSPVADTSGSLFTLEGCAAISDVDGNLLFYTDGTTVWNQNHTIMPTGSGLLGDSSSSQSAIIVPKPGNTKIYYIFTIDWAGSDKGLNYYIVDMTLDGGLGDIVGTSGTPFPTNLFGSPATEKITAVQVLEEDNFWIISFKQGRFYVFKVDTNGVNDVPVMGNSGFLGWRDARGYLKVSPDGSKIVSANMTRGVFVYDFNSVTGIISNERKLDVLDRFPYGVEFSPQGKKLYVTTGDAQFKLEKLYQFTVNIPIPTSDNLNATRVELHSYFNSRSALQLGFDGKIYRAINEANFLGIINDPEADGTASNYVHNAISLGDKVSKQGLPQFIQSFFSGLIQTKNNCLGDATNFTIRSNKPILSIVWNFGDGSTSTLLNPTHTYATSGDYIITVNLITEEGMETITQTITISDLPNITTPITLQQCDGDTDGITVFNLREAEVLITTDIPTPTFTYHLTQADADANTSPIVNLSTFSNVIANQVFARVKNQFGCHRVAEVNLQVSITDAALANLMLEIRACDTDLIDGDDTNGITTFDFSAATASILNLFPPNQPITVGYYENIADALAEENIIDPSNYRNENSPFNQPIVVRVDSENGNACLGLGFYIALIVDPLPEFDVIDLQFACLNQSPFPFPIQVENPQDNYTYEWRDQGGALLSASSVSSIFQVLTVDDYFVTATTVNNCTRTKKVTVIESNIATIQNIEIVDDSDNNTVTINVTGEGNYEFALGDINGPYQDEMLFENVPLGLHTVFIRDKNGCGVISEEVSIVGFPRFFTPNGDGFNDSWQVFGVSFQLDSKIYIFDRFGKVLAKIDPAGEGWDGTYRGKQMPSTDYWFKVELEDGRLRRGHFSLVRR